MGKQYQWMRVGDLSDAELASIVHLAHYHSTGLLELLILPDGSPEARLIGSGTFIKVGNCYGLLTAQHVADRIEDLEQLGLVILEREHRLSIPVQHLRIINIGTPEPGEKGPDLSAIVMPRAEASKIAPYKGFWDLQLVAEDMLNNRPDDHDGVWLVCGVPDEYTEYEETVSTFETVVGIHGVCWAGGIGDHYEKDGFDYIEVRAEYKEDRELPSSFGGISGGGLWQVLLRSDETGMSHPVRHLFLGLPFWQSARKEDWRTITCHGPASIYKQLLSQIAEMCS